MLAGIKVLYPFSLRREVTKARDKATGKLVALKKIRMENEKDGVCEIGRAEGMLFHVA